MGSLIPIIILIVIVIFGWNYISPQIDAFLGGTKSFLNDSNVAMDKPKDNTPVYDLIMNMKIKAKGGSLFSGEYVFFLNQDGGTFTRSWINPHIYKNSLLSLFPMNLLSYFEARSEQGIMTDLATNEIFIGSTNSILPVHFKLSFVLVDPDTNLQIKPESYQNVPFSIPADVSTYTIDYKLKIKDLPKKDYELWIFPVTENLDFKIRFVDHAVGEKYVQKISG